MHLLEITGKRHSLPLTKRPDIPEKGKEKDEMKNQKLLIAICAAVIAVGLCAAGLFGLSMLTADTPAHDTSQQPAEDSPVVSDEVIDDPAQEPVQEEPDTTPVQEPEADAQIVVKEGAEVTFSHEDGIYPEKFELTVNADNAVEILYTIDGSDPRTSDGAAVYSGGITITDGKNRGNVVSAVSPLEISANFNNRNKDRTDFECWIEAPSADAVDKCTVVKAAARYSDGSYSPVATSTYFVGTPEEHIEGLAESTAAAGYSLAVISISVDYDDMFGYERGIYVKGATFYNALEQYRDSHNGRVDDDARAYAANYKQRGRDWERPAHIEFFEFDTAGASLAFSQDCGIRVQGNYSRSDLQKGLRLIADTEYGDNRFRYAIFGDRITDEKGETIDKFKSVVLRAGGNCAFLAKFNDTYWQSLCTSLDCDTKASRPCVVYLNGEYWGLYVLEEDYSKQYFSTHYGVNHDDVVVYKGDAETYEIGYKLDIGEVPEGAEVDYYYKQLLSFFSATKDLKSQSAYDAFSKLVDVESVRDYFAAEIWINNKWDWPGKNWSMWRTLTMDENNEYADCRWRFSFYDVEFGGISGADDTRTNTIKEDNYKPLGLLDMDTGNPAVLCFAYLMTNEGFRADFYEKLRSLGENEFDRETALAKLEEFENIYGPLFDQFFERYPGTGSYHGAIESGYGSSENIRIFLNGRHENIEKMIDWAEKQYN